MKPTKLTSAPEGFEYYRVCDRYGVCRVVRGSQKAHNLVDGIESVAAMRTSLRGPEWP